MATELWWAKTSPLWARTCWNSRLLFTNEDQQICYFLSITFCTYTLRHVEHSIYFPHQPELPKISINTPLLWGGDSAPLKSFETSGNLSTHPPLGLNPLHAFWSLLPWTTRHSVPWHKQGPVLFLLCSPFLSKQYLTFNLLFDCYCTL